MAIRRADLQLAEQLDLAFQPYATDPALMCIVLDALVRRGWEPAIHYDPIHRSWHCMLRGPGYHRMEDPSLPKAVVYAALNALDVDVYRA